MGRMKEKFIEMLNKRPLDSIDDVPMNDASMENTPPCPSPIDADPSTGNFLWVIKEYKIWAKTYQQALDIISFIEQSPEHEPDNQ